MAGPPKGADIPDEMGAKSEASGSKYTKIEAGYAKADTTSLTFDVPAAGGTKDFDVK
jgi:hypothetical protein